MMMFVQNHDVLNISHQTGSTVLNNNVSLMDSGNSAHFVAGNEVFYGHIHCILEKRRRSICHQQFVVQIANTKGHYFSVDVQNKREKKKMICIWGDKNVAWTY